MNTDLNITKLSKINAICARCYSDNIRPLRDDLGKLIGIADTEMVILVGDCMQIDNSAFNTTFLIYLPK